jgi:hypothetical protein
MPKQDEKEDVVEIDDSNVRRNLDVETSSESQGPQMFTPEQLPDPSVARAAGLPPQAIPATQIIDGEDAYSHPRGPEPGEQVRAEQRRAIVDRVVENDDVPGVPETPVQTVASRNLAEAAVEPEPTSALGRALQKRAEGDDDVERDEAGRPIDPEGVQETSNELAEKKGMNEGDGEQIPEAKTADEAKKAEKKNS